MFCLNGHTLEILKSTLPILSSQQTLKSYNTVDNLFTLKLSEAIVLNKHQNHHDILIY